MAVAYFDVQQARGTLAGTLDAVAKCQVLVQKTRGLARGAIPEIEVVAACYRSISNSRPPRIAQTGLSTSARLTRLLRLNPSVVIVPLEPPHLQVLLISLECPVADLVPVGL